MDDAGADKAYATDVQEDPVCAIQLGDQEKQQHGHDPLDCVAVNADRPREMYVVAVSHAHAKLAAQQRDARVERQQE
jgi:hypothetical protein